jgi:flagellar biosynthesis/type III secretory pathway chaperone
MDAGSILDRLEQLLEEERCAVRKLDGARVQAVAEEKLALVQRLSAIDRRERAAVAPKIRVLVAKLRRNGILLVHARGILAELLRLRGVAPVRTPSRFGGARGRTDGVRLSIRG